MFILKSNYDVRLDQFDYERFGIEERWRYRETVAMLTSYEMEARGLYDRADYLEVCEKIYKKYDSYLYNCLYLKKFEYQSALDFEPEPGTFQFDMDYASFDKNVFLDYVESSKALRIDIERLRRVLTGEEVLGATEPSNQPANAAVTLESKSEHADVKLIRGEGSEVHVQKDHVPVIATTNGLVVDESHPDRVEKYLCQFEKTGKGWNLRYGDAVLVGVKDWLGMTYIKNLLENPGVKIGVLDLQQMAGYCGDDGEEDYEQDHSSDDADNPSSGGISAWEAVDATARGSYRNRLEVIAAEVKDALDAGNETKVATLREEAAFIQKELQQGSFKSKDPEIDKSRKRVTKAIIDTIKNIGKLEGICGYGDKPISGHLKRHINTGSFCSYTVIADKLPDWRF